MSSWVYAKTEIDIESPDWLFNYSKPDVSFLSFITRDGRRRAGIGDSSRPGQMFLLVLIALLPVRQALLLIILPLSTSALPCFSYFSSSSCLLLSRPLLGLLVLFVLACLFLPPVCLLVLLVHLLLLVAFVSSSRPSHRPPLICLPSSASSSSSTSSSPLSSFSSSSSPLPLLLQVTVQR